MKVYCSSDVLYLQQISLFHFLSVQEYGCKNPGGPLIMIFPGVSISRYTFPGGKVAQLPFPGWDTENFFSYHFFTSTRDQINCLRFNYRGFMSQTIILPRAYCFLKIWSSIPLYGKKNELPISKETLEFNFWYFHFFVRSSTFLTAFWLSIFMLSPPSQIDI